jgi:hypothetical protein
MFDALGASMTPDKLQPYFAHPGNNSVNIYIMIDVCHMPKLIRNTMATQVICDREGIPIKWSYIQTAPGTVARGQTGQLSPRMVSKNLIVLYMQQI